MQEPLPFYFFEPEKFMELASKSFKLNRKNWIKKIWKLILRRTKYALANIPNRNWNISIYIEDRTLCVCNVCTDAYIIGNRERFRPTGHIPIQL